MSTVFTLVSKLKPVLKPLQHDTLLQYQLLKGLQIADPNLGGAADIYIGVADIQACLADGRVNVEGAINTSLDGALQNFLDPEPKLLTELFKPQKINWNRTSIRQGHTRKPVYRKVYAAVFVCLTTKAVHLGFCKDLSTKEFLATLSRFIKHRGVPHTMWSDNGTNFVGAKYEIRDNDSYPLQRQKQQ